MSHGATPSLERLRERLIEDPALSGAGPTSVGDVRSAVARAVRAEGVLLPPEQLSGLVRDISDELTALGPAQPLLRDPAVTDVLINGPFDVWVERSGALEQTGVRFPDAEAVAAAVIRMIAPLGLRFDRAHPFVDARLPDGSRLHALLPPLAPHGPVVTVRKFAAVLPAWSDLEASGSVPADAQQILQQAVVDRRAIVCCGRTGTGKTTLLNLLLGWVPDSERIVVIEDAPELRPRCRHLVHLETRPANAEGSGGADLRDLVRQSLRMRPDRIVVGEVRGVELVDVLQALVTGHEGCMTTVHARSTSEALVRLEGMALLAGIPLAAARAQLRAALDLVVVLGRGPGGLRGIVEIATVDGDGDDGLTATNIWRRASW